MTDSPTLRLAAALGIPVADPDPPPPVPVCAVCDRPAPPALHRYPGAIAGHPGCVPGHWERDRADWLAFRSAIDPP